MALIHKGLSYLRQKRQVPPIAASISSLQDWFNSPLGKQLLIEQQCVLDQALSCLFGYHLLQLSVHQNAKLYDNSRVCHCVSVSPAQLSAPMSAGLCSDWDALPFEDDSVDVTVLHHALDFSDNPHQVLREAARVTIARGYIIIIGFNPFSPMGMAKPFAQLFNAGPVWQRNSLRRARIGDWLKFLDCQVVNSESRHYCPPVQNERFLKHAHKWSAGVSRWPLASLALGNFYCLVARKDRVALTPIRPKWLPQTTLVPRAKQALSTRSAAKLTLVSSSKPHPGSK